MPIKFPGPDPYTFQQTQELREMLQRGTGGYDLPSGADSSRTPATTMSMVVGSIIKRSRRTLSNIDRNFLTPLVQKFLYRYMQFDPERFPMKDYKFTVRATMGIMAREFEQGQLVSLLSTVPNDSPAFWMLIKGIYDNSNIKDRDQMMAYADQMIQRTMNPQPPPPDPMVELNVKRIELDTKIHQDKMDLEAVKAMQLDRVYESEIKRDVGEGKMMNATAVLQLVKAETEQLKVAGETTLNVAKAQTEQFNAKLASHQAALDTVNAHVEMMKASQVSRGTEEAKITKTDIKPEADLTPILKELAGMLQGQTEHLKTVPATASADAENSQADISIPGHDEILGKLQELSTKLDGMTPPPAQPPEPPPPPPSIERGPDGMVTSVSGRPVKRDAQGRLAGLE